MCLYPAFLRDGTKYLHLEYKCMMIIHSFLIVTGIFLGSNRTKMFLRVG